MAGIRHPATILLVEDDETLRDFARRVLTKHRYHVIEACDGKAALDLASAHEGPIHLLLTDIQMPKLNGLILAERLTHQRRVTSVCFMSGFAKANQAVANYGDAVLLQKPFTRDDLIQAVRTALDTTGAEE